MLQYKGAKTGLITTKGFRDALEMRRAHKEDIWDLSLTPPPPIIPRYLRLGVTERLNYAGEIITPLDEEETREILERLADPATGLSFVKIRPDDRRAFLQDEMYALMKEHLLDVLPDLQR